MSNETVADRRAARRRERIRSLEIEADGISYDERELREELAKAQRIYAGKLEKFNARMVKIIKRRQELGERVAKLP
jgi:hypothetical protein